MRLLTLRNIAQSTPSNKFLLVNYVLERAFQLIPNFRRAAAAPNPHRGAAQGNLSGNGNGYDAKNPN